MSSDAPKKDELPKELGRVLNTLTEDAQNAGLRKCAEMNFDPNKGRISLEETLINLTQARDLLADAISTGKFVQLPLKVQYTLFDQVQAVARELTSLTGGTDAVINLDLAVEELNASVWQFQLHNLSDKVLGFQSKMNQLKSQETTIRQAARAAEEFDTLRKQADETLKGIVDRARAATEEQAVATKLVEQLRATAKDATEVGQKVSALGTQIEQHETTATQQLSTAKQAAADTEAIATKSKEMRAEIEASRDALQDLTTKTQQLLATSEKTTAEQTSRLESVFEKLHDETQTTTTELTSKLDKAIFDLSTQTTTKIEALNASTDTRIADLVEKTSGRLEKAETKQDARLTEQLRDFTEKGTAATQEFVTKGTEALKAGDENLQALVKDLNDLEGQIRQAIERATGYTLFHAFQKRQLDLAKSKDFWAKALAACVVLSLCLSGLFIYSLRFVTDYNAAFYLKLSISIPIIYAIAFCNLQYARERKLEEEYAFKSSVSISLDPYQKLVATLIDRDKPEELAKYTAFVIHSVDKVFTSPTDPIFEGRPSDKNYAEKIIKSVGDVIEPLVKALRR